MRSFAACLLSLYLAWTLCAFATRSGRVQRRRNRNVQAPVRRRRCIWDDVLHAWMAAFRTWFCLLLCVAAVATTQLKQTRINRSPDQSRIWVGQKPVQDGSNKLPLNGNLCDVRPLSSLRSASVHSVLSARRIRFRPCAACFALVGEQCLCSSMTCLCLQLRLFKRELDEEDWKSFGLRPEVFPEAAPQPQQVSRVQCKRLPSLVAAADLLTACVARFVVGDRCFDCVSRRCRARGATASRPSDPRRSKPCACHSLRLLHSNLVLTFHRCALVLLLV